MPVIKPLVGSVRTRQTSECLYACMFVCSFCLQFVFIYVLVFCTIIPCLDFYILEWYIWCFVCLWSIFEITSRGSLLRKRTLYLLTTGVLDTGMKVLPDSQEFRIYICTHATVVPVPAPVPSFFAGAYPSVPQVL